MKVEASGVLMALPEDVWKLLAEPYHLPDWFPGYQGVEPDRRGLAEGARWRIVRGSTRAATSDLLRRPGGQATLVITRVVEGSALAWHDAGQHLDVQVSIGPVAERRTEVTVAVEAPGWRVVLEGMGSAPRQAVRRLYDLCQTAAEL
jgi:uncharacterized protein YndB with AHSA1/START domain